jgi:type II secretory pathway pseudopilin PulG
MNELTLIELAAGLLCVIVVGGLAVINLRRSRQPKTKALAQVQTRRALLTRLNEIVRDQDDAEHILKLEAKRLNLPSTSSLVLEASIMRALRGADYWESVLDPRRSTN